MKTLNPIKNPRVTEKASTVVEQNVYTFNVATSANKKEIEKAIFLIYKVKPLKINISNIPHKNVLTRGKKGTKGGGKKAIVYLKKDDKIEFI
jgi:large subunit ribosomal protein L23